jgi:hypothetical protein
MFDYPFLKIGDNIYNKLGVKPDCTKDEINKAKSLYKSQLGKLINDLQMLLELKTAESSVIKPGDNDEHKNQKKSKKNIQADLISAGINVVDPEMEIERLNEEILKINAFDPGKTEKRDEYDLLFPPAILLRTGYDIPKVYTDRRTLLFVLREDLVNFFENSKKLRCYHPSDLSRKDFSSDFRPNDILDK